MNAQTTGEDTVGSVRSAAVLVLQVLAAAITAIAVPVIWLLVAARIQGAAGVTHMTKQTALAIFPGIIISYVFLMSVFGRIVERGREAAGEAVQRAWPVRRAAWNRSMRDERYRPGGASLSPIEITFVIIATAATIAFGVWFLFFAGSPLE